MASSTAVTAALATRLRDSSENQAILHCAMSAASAVMFARVMVPTGALALLAGLPFVLR